MNICRYLPTRILARFVRDEVSGIVLSLLEDPQTWTVDTVCGVALIEHASNRILLRLERDSAEIFTGEPSGSAQYLRHEYRLSRCEKEVLRRAMLDRMRVVIHSGLKDHQIAIMVSHITRTLMSRNHAPAQTREVIRQAVVESLEEQSARLDGNIGIKERRLAA